MKDSTQRVVAFVVVAALVVASVAAVVSLVAVDAPSAATVGDTKISRDDVNDELEALADNDALRRAIEQAGAPKVTNQDGSVTAEIAAGWLGLTIAQELAARAVAKRGLETTAADRNQGKALAAQSVGGANVYDTLPDWFQERLRDRWTGVATLERDLVANPSAALQQALAAQCPSGRYVSHILVQSDAEAQQIEEELAAGGDFAEIAQRSSLDTGSAPQGGSLGCLDGSDFVEPFATVARTQPIGEVSEPFTTEFGSHIVLVTDEPAASDVRSAALDEVLRRGRGEDVDVNERYGRWHAASGQILPPLVREQVPAATP